MINTKFDLVLITPFINDKNINTLLQSIDSKNYYKILIVIIDMSNLELNFNEFRFINNFQLVHIKKNSILSSSASRNVGLNYLFSNKIDFNYLMFPDDDTSFNFTFWHNFSKLNKGNYILNVLNNGTNTNYANYKKKDGEVVTKRDVNFIGCVRFLYTKELVYQIGFFDERMGVGAIYGAGEDGDYFLRSMRYSKIYYKEFLYTFHPSASDKYSAMSLNIIYSRFANYGKGVMFLYCKHKMYYNAFFLIFRGLVGSLFYLFKLRLKFFIIYLGAFFIRLKYFVKFIMIKID
jgi:hypothetical protein